jgi:DNA-binding CsgD family transcriptional regulator
MHSLRLRPARVDDIEPLLEVLACPGDGYGPTPSPGLAPLVRRLVREGAVTTVLLEERTSEGLGRAKFLGAAMTGFVELAAIRKVIASPPPHVVDSLFEQERAGTDTFLRPSRLGPLNEREGLGFVFLAYRLVPPPAGATPDRQISAMFESFRLFYTGFHCPLSVHPAPSTPSAERSLLGLHFRPVGDGQRLWQLREEDLGDAPFSPFVVLRKGPSPRLRFSDGEKQMLFYALLGYSDVEIAEHLGLSLETVRKRWRSAFDRASECEEPRILRHYEGATRGPEKRGSLLEYLDSHLEELRPGYGVRAGQSA